MPSGIFKVFAWKADSEHGKISSDYEYELERLDVLKEKQHFRTK
jgi:hypothetical protein